MLDNAHPHIDLLKAWDLWLHGKDIKADGDVMWGLRMFWWGRIGVIAGLLGGLIIVLDIINERKLEEFIRKSLPIKMYKNLADKSPRLLEVVITGTALLFIGFFAASLVVGGSYLDLEAIIFGAYTILWVILIVGAKVLSGDGLLMTVARIFALLMLIVSAHFTLLAS